MQLPKSAVARAWFWFIVAIYLFTALILWPMLVGGLDGGALGSFEYFAGLAYIFPILLLGPLQILTDRLFVQHGFFRRGRALGAIAVTLAGVGLWLCLNWLLYVFGY